MFDQLTISTSASPTCTHHKSNNNSSTTLDFSLRIAFGRLPALHLLPPILCHPSQWAAAVGDRIHKLKENVDEKVDDAVEEGSKQLTDHLRLAFGPDGGGFQMMGYTQAMVQNLSKAVITVKKEGKGD
jgi:hypothetical protein